MSTTLMSQSTPAQRVSAPLAFWSANMTRIDDAGMSWPGFTYNDADKARMRALSQHVDDAAYLKFQFWTAAVFITIAAASIAVLFTWMSWLYPDPSQTPASVFVCMLAACALLTIGFGVPAAMSLASRLSSFGLDLPSVAAAPGDEALARTISFQCWRMTAIMCGVFVPGTLLWIAYDIDGGPAVTWLRNGAIGLMLASMWFARRR